MPSPVGGAAGQPGAPVPTRVVPEPEVVPAHVAILAGKTVAPTAQEQAQKLRFVLMAVCMYVAFMCISAHTHICGRVCVLKVSSMLP